MEQWGQQTDAEEPARMPGEMELAAAQALVEHSKRERIQKTAAELEAILARYGTQLASEVQVTQDGRLVGVTKIVLA